MYIMYMFLMRDEKEERSKQGQTINKAKEHSIPSLGSRPSPYVRVLIARGWANRSSGFDLPTPAQLKRARKGKAWNRGYSIPKAVTFPKKTELPQHSR